MGRKTDPPSPPPVAPKLATIGQVRRECALLYRRVRAGTVTAQDGARMGSLLSIVARLIAESDLEQRLCALEARAAGPRRVA